MQQLAVGPQHDVIVMPVRDSEHVRRHAVGRTRVRKAFHTGSPCLWLWIMLAEPFLERVHLEGLGGLAGAEMGPR